MFFPLQDDEVYKTDPVVPMIVNSMKPDDAIEACYLYIDHCIGSNCINRVEELLIYLTLFREEMTISTLLAPLAYTCTFQEAIVGRQQYYAAIKRELERRGETEQSIRELLVGL